MAAAELAGLGYEYVPGATGARSDWVLRQKADKEKGFEWRGQEDYDRLGAAVVRRCQEMLIEVGGLHEVRLPAGGGDAPASRVFASPTVAAAAAGVAQAPAPPRPLLLLICGSAPGGAAAVWGRSLCINATLHEGSMLDYVSRAAGLGWDVVVANPGENGTAAAPLPGSESPHRHLRAVWDGVVAKTAAAPVLAVAHSYGGPLFVSLLKDVAAARERLACVAFTDAEAFEPGVLQQERVPDDAHVAKAQKREAAERLQADLRRWSELCPTAFAPADPAVAAWLKAAARNFVASDLPLGAVVAADREGVPCVSAGHKSHPSTTHAATEPVFAFLQEGAAGAAAESNAKLRAGAGGG